MRQYAAETLLWLFVINLGIAFGAGLYEKRVSVPQWFPASSEAGRRVNSEAMRQADAAPGHPGRPGTGRRRHRSGGPGGRGLRG